MKPFVPTLLFAGIGFLAGFVFPRSGAERHDLVEKPNVRLLPRQAGADEPSWAAPNQSPAQRMCSLANHAASLTPAQWPAFFQARMNDPEGTQLLERLWAEQDPDGFWNWLKQQHDGTLLREYGKNLLRTWASADPDAAMSAANAITDKESSDFLRREVIETVIAADLTKGLELAANALDFNRFSWGPREWMKKDPAAAVQGLAGLPGRSEYRDFLKYAVVAWAETDSRAMLDWLKTQSFPDREEWFGDAFKAAAVADSKSALEAASGLADPIARDAAIAGVLASGRVSNTEMTGLLGRLSLSKCSEATYQALESIPTKSDQEFADATRLLSDAPANRNMLNKVDSLAGHWTDRSPAQGFAWAAALPDSAMRRRALASLAFHTKRDQMDALAAAVAKAPLLDLSNDLFRNILQSLPDDQEAAWLAKLPPERAAWGRAVAESVNP